jgi:hypothetical protein
MNFVGAASVVTVSQVSEYCDNCSKSCDNLGYKTWVNQFKRGPVASVSLEWKFNVRVIIKSDCVGVLASLGMKF